MTLPHETATSGERAIQDMQKLLRSFGCGKRGMPLADCQNCTHRVPPSSSAHCYMFKAKPGTHCAQFQQARRPIERIMRGGASVSPPSAA